MEGWRGEDWVMGFGLFIRRQIEKFTSDTCTMVEINLLRFIGTLQFQIYLFICFEIHAEIITTLKIRTFQKIYDEI